MNSYLTRLNGLAIPSRKRGSVVSLFCGGGGLDLGLELAGFNCAFATDIEPSFCSTVAHNLETMAEPQDVQALTGSYIRSKIGSKSVTVVAGGPPCQAFSILGQRKSMRDPRGKLVFEYVRIIQELEPETFLFENVPGLLTVHGGRDWQALLELFHQDTGYEIHHCILNSADFGIPQIRRRLFVVGFRDKNRPFKFPSPTHHNPASHPLLASSSAAWLPSKLAFEGLTGLKNHDVRIHGDRVRKRYERIPQGERDKTDHTDRVHPERPSGTVLVGSRAGGGRPFIHPYAPRHISVREAARLQSFPDWYEILGTGTQQYRQIGNAVPPLLALEVGRAVSGALAGAMRESSHVASL